MCEVGHDAGQEENHTELKGPSTFLHYRQAPLIQMRHALLSFLRGFEESSKRGALSFSTTSKDSLRWGAKKREAKDHSLAPVDRIEWGTLIPPITKLVPIRQTLNI